MNEQKETQYKIGEQYKIGDLVRIHLPHWDSSWEKSPKVVRTMSSANGEVHRVLNVINGSSVSYILRLKGTNYKFIERWLRPVNYYNVVNIYTKEQNKKESK